MNTTLFDTASGSLVLLLVLLVGQAVLFGLPPLIWGLFAKGDKRDLFSLRPASRNAFIGATLLALGMALLSTPFLALQTRLGILPYNPQTIKAQTQMFLPMFRYWPVLAALTIPIAAATTEEFFFRGALQTSLLKRFPVWPTLWLVSLTFALLHFDLSGTPFRTLLGLLFAWMTFGSRSLWPAIWAHFFYDALLLGLGAWQTNQMGTKAVLDSSAKPNMGTSPEQLAMLAVTGSILLAVGLWMTIVEHRKTAQIRVLAEGNETHFTESVETGR